MAAAFLVTSTRFVSLDFPVTSTHLDMWRQIHARRIAAALTATATAVAGWNASTSTTCADDKSMTPSELTAYLRRHLASFRQAFAKTHPNIATQPIQISHQNNVVRIAFLAPSSSPSILHRFLKELGKPIEVSPSTSDESLQYIFTDATGSFQWLSTKSQGNLFVLFKDLPIYQREVDAVLAAYTHAYESLPVAKSTASSPKAAIATLQQLGLDVYDDTTSGELSWDALAGYDDVKTEIEDTVVLALQNPDIYENIAKHTRHRFESNRPRAILFEGPPGTGKTLSARIIAAQAKVPLIHLPIESVVSKWYGESEQKLSKIFDACDQLEDGAILFIDEIDALASDRSSGQMHEATRRLLSVLLQKVEGFASAKKVTLIAATNRKQDLDSALLSRFNLTIRYELPDLATRQAVFQRYAKQLKEDELKDLAAQTTNWSCRDIKELCEYTERKWASQVLRKKLHQPVPTLDAYVSAIQHQTEQRSNTSVHI